MYVQIYRAFINISCRRVTGFHSKAKLFEETLYKKHLLDGQSRWAKLSLLQVNLPSALPLLRTPAKSLVHWTPYQMAHHLAKP